MSSTAAEAGGQAAWVRAEDVDAAATGLAAQRFQERTEQRRQAEQALRRATEEHDAAAHRIEELTARRTRLEETAVWVRELAVEVGERITALTQAEADLQGRRAAATAAQTALDRVLEQTAAAGAAVDEADRELSDLASAALDEPGLRRELEVAKASLDAAEAEQVVARGALEDLLSDVAAVEARLDDLTVAEPLSGEPAPEDDLRRVAEACDNVRGVASMSRPDPEAEMLADALDALRSDLAELRSHIAPPADPGEVEAARARVATAADALAEIDGALARRAITPDQRAALDAAHTAVLEAEERSDRRVGGGGARKRLEEARAAEQTLLDQFGFPTYLDVMLSGGQVGKDDPERREAERALKAATDALGALEKASAKPPDVEFLESEQTRLTAQARELLGMDPGDAVVDLLREHRVVPKATIEELQDALSRVGVPTEGVSLVEAAESWLDEQMRLIERSATNEEARSALAGERVSLEARRDELVSTVDSARERVAAAEEAAELAARSVNAFEAELEACLGEAERRRDRTAAAEELRERVASLQATLQRSESDARDRLAEAQMRLQAAELTHTAEITSLTDLSERARILCEQVPAEQRPSGEPLEQVGILHDQLDGEIATVEQAVSDAERELAEAEANHQAATAAAAVLDVPDDELLVADAIEGFVTLLQGTSAAPLLVLDEPFNGVESAPRLDLLAAVVEHSTRQQVVLLTADPEILGWAIELPAETGALTGVDALFAPAQAPPAPEPQPALQVAPGAAPHVASPPAPMPASVPQQPVAAPSLTSWLTAPAAESPAASPAPTLAAPSAAPIAPEPPAAQVATASQPTPTLEARPPVVEPVVEPAPVVEPVVEPAPVAQPVVEPAPPALEPAAVVQPAPLVDAPVPPAPAPLTPQPTPRPRAVPVHQAGPAPEQVVVEPIPALAGLSDHAITARPAPVDLQPDLEADLEPAEPVTPTPTPAPARRRWAGQR